MPISIQQISSYFERYGWSYSEQTEDQSILTGFQGENSFYKIAAILRNGWLSLVVLDYLPEVPNDKEYELFKQSLEINSKIVFARLALTDANKITLVSELPAESRIDYDLFAMALDLISYFADNLYPRLFDLLNGNNMQSSTK